MILCVCAPRIVLFGLKKWWKASIDFSAVICNERRDGRSAVVVGRSFPLYASNTWKQKSYTSTSYNIHIIQKRVYNNAILIQYEYASCAQMYAHAYFVYNFVYCVFVYYYYCICIQFIGYIYNIIQYIAIYCLFPIKLNANLQFSYAVVNV